MQIYMLMFRCSVRVQPSPLRFTSLGQNIQEYVLICCIGKLSGQRIDFILVDTDHFSETSIDHC